MNKDHPQVIEIWNLVFMQYNRKADGTLEPLPAKVIDTGMGFERLVRTLQGKTSNYDTDVFQPIIKVIGDLSGKKYGDDEKTDVAMRVVADHIRTIAFSITDGQLPSNAKAGYVIRRILRRAVRYAYTFLGQKQAFMYKLVPVLIENMGGAYPELKAQQALIEKVMKEEEESFLRTLETGIRLLEKTMNETKAAGKTEISGVDAFTLYDTFGFPFDLTELILRENGLTADVKGFEAEMQKQKERARNAAAVETGDWVTLKEGETTFVGYDYTEYETSILRYRQIKQKNQTLYQIVLSETPFYAESGGQVGDTGVLVSEFETIDIIDTKKENNLPIHIAKKLPEHLEAPMMACVDTDKRAACAANHSCTHLLDEALRQVLGTHVEQKGSLVTPDSLRFDFSHFQKVTPEQIREVEHLVNAKIRENVPLTEYRNLPIEKAKELGAIALFGEKYGDEVRVVQFGSSIEFCGGTHVSATGKIGMVKIISESSVAAGVRRIEAVTGAKVEEMFDTVQDTINDLKALFNNAPDLKAAISKYIEENAGLKKQMEEFMKEKEAAVKNKLIEGAKEINGVKYYNPMMIYPAIHYTMGGIWVDYELQTTIKGLFAIGECNFSDHGANRLGASALMQGLADGYFVLPYTIQNYLADQITVPRFSTDLPEFAEAEKAVQDKIDHLMNIKGKKSVDSIHKELGRVMWEYVGMGRTAEGLKTGLAKLKDIRKEFETELFIPGSKEGLNVELDKAFRLNDFITMGELIAYDALNRNESCGGHFREEYQTEEGEAKRDDENFFYVACWEYQGSDDKAPVLYKEPLVYEAIKVQTRNYKS